MAGRKRLPREIIHILPSPSLDPEMQVSDLYKDGGIEIHLGNSQRSQALIGIKNAVKNANPTLKIIG